MADEKTEQKKNQEQETQEKAQSKPEEAQAKTEGGKGQLLQWIILTAVVILLAVAGSFLGNTTGNVPQPAQAQEETPTENTSENQLDLMTEDPAKAAGKGWYYDLDPVATNLSDPGSTRYVRAVLTLEISPEVDQTKGTQFLDDTKPVIANILNIYFAGLTIEDINSDKDMRRIQYELLEIFNETLYDDDKPLIRQVLFKEFGLQ